MASVYIQLPPSASISGTVTTDETALVPDFQEITNLTNVAQTITAPADAKWVKISSGGQNTAPIRVKLGGVATTTSGIRMEASRTEDFMVAGNISVICETAATNQYVCATFGY